MKVDVFLSNNNISYPTITINATYTGAFEQICSGFAELYAKYCKVYTKFGVWPTEVKSNT